MTPEQEFTFIARQKRSDIIAVIQAMAAYEYPDSCYFCEMAMDYAYHEKTCPVHIAQNMLIDSGLNLPDDFEQRSAK